MKIQVTTEWLLAVINTASSDTESLSEISELQNDIL